MNPVEQEENRAFRELVQAFERFRQAHESAVMARMREAMERRAAVPPPRHAPSQPPPQAKLLTRQQAAEYLGVKPSTLAAWQCTRRYSLPLVKVGRSVRYRLADLERWLADQTQDKPAE